MFASLPIWITKEYKAISNTLFCRLRLSICADICSMYFSLLLTSSFPSSRKLSDFSTILTVFFPPNNPARPFFFSLTIRVRTVFTGLSARPRVKVLSSVSWRFTVCMIVLRCLSFSAKRERKLSTFPYAELPMQKGFTDTNTLSAARRFVLYMA